MTMTACRECKADVSASAEACPNCGAKAPGGTRGRQIAGLVYLALVIWAFVWIWGLLTPDEKTTANSAADVVAEESNSAALSTRAEWYEGGTLHDANGLAWQQASYADKLATSADLLAALWQGGALKPAVSAKISTVDDLKPLAAGLVKQLDDVFAPEADPEQNKRLFTNQKVKEMAVMTLMMMGWTGT